tara:strand:- start:320 stop:796 length:477 start_codon:yes stop_codon:yes gene_type:complete
MILKISDLKDNFYNKKFQVPVDYLPERGTRYKENNIKCVFTSEKYRDGFKIFGEITAKIELECVKCLSKLIFTTVTPAKVVINNKKKDNEELIKIKNNIVDLGDYLSDAIALSSPDYPVCSDLCKGLCYNCGINKNDKSCACKIDKKADVWDDIKSII